MRQADAVPSIDGATVPRRRSTVHTVRIDDEAVLLDTAMERLHLLNSTAAAVWDNLDGETTIGHTAAALAASFGTTYEVVLDDTLRAVRQMWIAGLIEVEHHSPGRRSR